MNPWLCIRPPSGAYLTSSGACMLLDIGDGQTCILFCINCVSINISNHYGAGTYWLVPLALLLEMRVTITTVRVEAVLKDGAVGIGDKGKNPIKPIIIYRMGGQYVLVCQAHDHHNPLLYHYMSDFIV